MDLKICGHTLQLDKKVSPNYTIPDMRFRPRAMENSPQSSQVFSHIFRTLVIWIHSPSLVITGDETVPCEYIRKAKQAQSSRQQHLRKGIKKKHKRGAKSNE